MDRFQPPNPDTAIQKKPQQVIEREQSEKGERDEKLALSILEAYLRSGVSTGATGKQIADECETLWKWVTTDEWPPKN